MAEATGLDYTWVNMSIIGDAGVPGPNPCLEREGTDTELTSLVRRGRISPRGFCVPQHCAIHL